MNKNTGQDFKAQILNSVVLALREDVGSGDITTNSIVPAGKTTTATIIAKEAGIICGMGIAQLVFHSIDKNIKFTPNVKDGDLVRAGTVLVRISGNARAILTAERTALNYLQRLSGISTLTNKYVKAAGKNVTILDTRKTAPGMRVLEKYAVGVGGGVNHRIGLFDAVLIKDNHITVVGSIRKAVNAAQKKYSSVEIETKKYSQVIEAVSSGASRILLDNMDIAGIKNAVKLIKNSTRKIEIEVSGGVNIKNVGKIAKTGIDYISIGALTHSAPALDINLKVF